MTTMATMLLRGSVARALLTFVASVGLVTSGTAQLPRIELGAYDPYGTFSREREMSIEHVYVPWEDVDLASINAADAYASGRGRRLLVTVEPWSWRPSVQAADPTALYYAIVQGAHDGRIKSICGALANLRTKAEVRFAHEMDIANRRYPWARWSPPQYIAAYRHFVTTCRGVAPNLMFMWSPRGEKNMADYYPGSSFVDTVGLSVFGYQAYDRGEVGRDRYFAELLEPSYKIAAKFEKPIVVAEFGCEGDEQYERKCLLDGLARLQPGFPRLVAVVYFNEVETFPWPAPYGLPDWRLRVPFRLTEK